MYDYDEEWCDDMNKAPKDGTIILGWGRIAWDSTPDKPKPEPRAVEMYWDKYCETWNVPSATPYEEVCHATHWRKRLRGPKLKT